VGCDPREEGEPRHFQVRQAECPVILPSSIEIDQDGHQIRPQAPQGQAAQHQPGERVDARRAQPLNQGRQRQRHEGSDGDKITRAPRGEPTPRGQTSVVRDRQESDGPGGQRRSRRIIPEPRQGNQPQRHQWRVRHQTATRTQQDAEQSVPRFLRE
jgi:hypothetical protein